MHISVAPHRRRHVSLAVLAALLFAALVAGCEEDPHSLGELEAVWGRRGVSEGRLHKPRAMAIDAEDHLYIVDMTARIQVFTPEGEYLRGWSTPIHEDGRPTGLSFDQSGNLLVADTHYFRVLVYTPQGELLQTIGGDHGNRPGEFGLVTDAVQDRAGNYYIAEYGEYDRIQKFDPQGEFILQWGGHGREPGQFVRPQKIEIDGEDRIWVADACNHRIQVFDNEGHLLFLWGEQGSGLGQLSYPYDLELDGQGHVYVMEYGNHRVQKFTLDGKSLGAWGTNGRRPGQMHNPWALVRDSHGTLHLLDTNNHRVQRIRM